MFEALLGGHGYVDGRRGRDLVPPQVGGSGKQGLGIGADREYRFERLAGGTSDPDGGLGGGIHDESGEGGGPVGAVGTVVDLKIDECALRADGRGNEAIVAGHGFAGGGELSVHGRKFFPAAPIFGKQFVDLRLMVVRHGSWTRPGCIRFPAT